MRFGDITFLPYFLMGTGFTIGTPIPGTFDYSGDGLSMLIPVTAKQAHLIYNRVKVWRVQAGAEVLASEAYDSFGGPALQMDESQTAAIDFRLSASIALAGESALHGAGLPLGILPVYASTMDPTTEPFRGVYIEAADDPLTVYPIDAMNAYETAGFTPGLPDDPDTPGDQSTANTTFAGSARLTLRMFEYAIADVGVVDSENTWSPTNGGRFSMDFVLSLGSWHTTGLTGLELQPVPCRPSLETVTVTGDDWHGFEIRGGLVSPSGALIGTFLITPSEWWPYENDDGDPLYDSGTGEPV